MTDLLLRLAKLPPEKRRLLEERLRGERPHLVELRPHPRDGGPLRLSFAQQRLWFIDQLEPGRSTYNMPYALRVGGRLHLPALERALGEVVRRHESLRTRFPLREGEPVQQVDPARTARLPLVDLGGIGEGGREAELARLAAAEARRPFDLAAGPLLRTTVVRLGDEEAAVLFTLHHIVTDGWSMGILVRELSALYGAFTRGEEPVLPGLPVQYADYAEWQRVWLRGETLAKQAGYWRERLAGAPALLEIPTDHPRPPVASDAGATLGFALGAEATAALGALAREEGATPFMALLAAWQWVLGRYAAQEDVVVGTPIAGRTRAEVEGLIGFFVNTLVLRAEVPAGTPFRELLRRVRDSTLQAYAHQDLPFEKLVEELGAERSLAYAPVFQALFSFQNNEGAELELGASGLKSVGVETPSAMFDLTLDLAEVEGEVRGTLTYRTDLWERGSMARLLEHYGRVLEAAVRRPEQRMSELAPPRGAGLVPEPSAGPARRCVHELFAEQAARTPDAAALVFGDRTLTYAELERESDRLARHLRRLGAGPETRVGICMERSSELVVGILGTLKAGAACVPLDPEYPAERLAYVLADAGVALLLTQENLVGRLPEHAARVVLVDAPLPRPLPHEGGGEHDGSDSSSAFPQNWGKVPSLSEADGAAASEPTVGPGNLAYVIYTSGSTGTPKGVAVEHGAAAAHLAGFARELGIGPGDRVLHFASFGFDVSIEQLFLPLLTGGTVVLRGPEPWNPAEWPARVRELGITVGNLPPAYWLEVIETAPPVELPGLRCLLVGADAMPSAAVRRWREAFPGPARLVNGYGPTEAVVTATAFPLPADYPAGYPGATVPIGGALPGRAAYVLDGDGTPVPDGAPGELCLGGDRLARGYLGRPDATAERFVPDPFGGTPGGRLYRTGDRVRRLVSGELEFLGRVDRQVKVRGFRIEPGEVEAALLRHPAVRGCAVVAREDAPGERRLVAYVVPGGMEAPAAELRAHLAARLPEYMVPSAFVTLEALPLTPHGKLDRRALPAPDRAGERDAFVEPRTPTEEVLAGIWAEVLGVERIGVEANFFEMGGHSLLATRVASRVWQAFEVQLPVRALFESPTVAGLAARVEAEQRREDAAAAAEGAAPAGERAAPVLSEKALFLLRKRRAERKRAEMKITRRTGDGPAPLSFAQQRLWLVDRLRPGQGTYNMPAPVRVRGPLDRVALERALAAVVARHEPLRTRFPLRDGEPVQQVDPAGPVRLPVVDLGGLDERTREAEVDRLVAAESRRPFDLAAGPLLRAAVVRLGERDATMLFTLHHIVSDGWSMGVFIRELSALYEAFARGAEPRLPELPVQYADHAVWQRGWLTGEVLEREVEYWRERLSGAPALLELPTDRPRPRVASDAGGARDFTIDAATTARLRALSRSEGATLFMTLLAGWQLLLARWSGQDDVVVGTPIAGRHRLETEGLIGFFVNTLVLRADLSEDPGFRALLAQVRETTLGAYQHQDLPFEKLVEELGVERSLAYTPLFQVMFNLQNNQRGDLRLGEAEMESLRGNRPAAKFDLSMSLLEAEGEVRGELTYRTELWEGESIGRMVAHYVRVLEEVSAHPERRVQEVSLLDAGERDQLLAASRGPERAFPDLGIHELFEARAARAPGAVALVLDGESLSYGELDRRANRL
ncbi:MAG: amino acid adenylation domain-containing protein, partial [Gemmatimonadetes bacterium]|nr:amino acid adenylation domain-containing protein [Gemmatimonadota bacterium]